MKEIYDVMSWMHLLEIEITSRCNQHCKYCYNRDEQIIDMPIEKIIQYLKLAEKYEIETVVISGGEASMHPQFYELCNILRKSKPKIKRLVIQSNGWIENIPINLLQVFDVVHLSYTLNKDSSRTYQTESNLFLAKKLKSEGIYSYLFTTITNQNKDDIDKLIYYANNHDIDIAFNLCCDTGKNKELLLSSEEKKEICIKLNNLYKEGKILPFKHPFTSILNGLSSKEFIGVKGGCTAGIAACVISAAENVYPCPFFRLSAGSLKSDSLEKIWSSSKVLQLCRARKLLHAPCNTCEHLSFCGGCRKIAYQNTGSLLGADVTCFLNERTPPQAMGY